MSTLNSSLRIRCKKDLIPRLKAIAEAKGGEEKYQTLARRQLERYAAGEEQKTAQRNRLQKKAA